MTEAQLKLIEVVMRCNSRRIYIMLLNIYPDKNITEEVLLKTFIQNTYDEVKMKLYMGVMHEVSAEERAEVERIFLCSQYEGIEKLVRLCRSKSGCRFSFAVVVCSAALYLRNAIERRA